MTQFLRLTILLICAAASFLNVSAQSRWKPAATDASGKIFYIGEDFSSEEGGNVLGWERSDLPPNKAYPVGAYFVTRSEWNCRESTNRHLGAFIYDRSGKFIEKLPVDTDWRYNPPDSIGEIILKAACGDRLKEKNSLSDRTNSGTVTRRSARRKAVPRRESDANAKNKRTRRKRRAR